MLELIAARKAPGDRILQYAHYYDVPVLAQLPPAHRFLNMYVFELMQGHESFHDPWVAEIEAAYRETPPAFVLLPGRQDAQGLPMFAPDPEERAVRGVTRALLASGYEVLLADDRATLLGRVRP